MDIIKIYDEIANRIINYSSYDSNKINCALLRETFLINKQRKNSLVLITEDPISDYLFQFRINQYINLQYDIHFQQTNRDEFVLMKKKDLITKYRPSINNIVFNKDCYNNLKNEFYEVFYKCLQNYNMRIGCEFYNFDNIISLFISNSNNHQKVEIILQICKFVHSRPFENLSKFINSIPFHTGIEMWKNYSEGLGGICAEKVNSIKFICDILGIENYLVACTSVQEKINLSSLIKSHIEDNSKEVPFIQHVMNKLIINDTAYYVDATGGNIPFLFINEHAAKSFLSKAYKVRLLHKTDKLFTHNLMQNYADYILNDNQFFAPLAHWEYTIEQGLGLAIVDDVHYSIFFNWGSECSFRMQEYYNRLSLDNKLNSPIFVELSDDSPHSLFGIKITEILKYILCCYENINNNYTGTLTAVISGMSNYHWKLDRISKN